MSGVNSVAYWKKMAESNWKQRSFAWAKFYEEVQKNAHTTYVIIRNIVIDIPRNAATGELERPAVLPPHITEEFMDMAIKLNKEFTCPCCFELMDKDTIHIAFCGHYVCKGCYERLVLNDKGKKSCPTCRKGI